MTDSATPEGEPSRIAEQAWIESGRPVEEGPR
jgi:hypothetical protein